MQNTLAISDRVLVNKLVYDVRSIHRGDIVVFSGNGSWNPGVAPKSTNVFAKFGNSVLSMFGLEPNQNDYIKRVIGLPGDHVACCDAQGRVTVNDVPLNEQSYLFPGNPPSETRFSITVPPGRLWVMGDHRDVSYDSRGHVGDPGGGTIPESAVVGRAFIVIWPVSQWTILGDPVNVPAAQAAERLAREPASSARTAQEAAAVAGAGVPAPPGRTRPAVRARLRRGGPADLGSAQGAAARVRQPALSPSPASFRVTFAPLRLSRPGVSLQVAPGATRCSPVPAGHFGLSAAFLRP